MSLIYNQLKKGLLDGTIIFQAPTVVKVMLVTNAYTPSAADKFLSASGATAAELSGTGYTAGFGNSGRKTLASRTFTQDDSGNRGLFGAANLTWSAINAGTAAAAIFIIETGGSDATSLLLAYLNDGGFPKATNGSDLVLQWAVVGGNPTILALT